MFLTALPPEAFVFLGFYSKNNDLIKTAHNHFCNKICMYKNYSGHEYFYDFSYRDLPPVI